jgi:hypothetical protein
MPVVPELPPELLELELLELELLELEVLPVAVPLVPPVELEAPVEPTVPVVPLDEVAPVELPALLELDELLELLVLAAGQMQLPEAESQTSPEPSHWPACTSQRVATLHSPVPRSQ